MLLVDLDPQANLTLGLRRDWADLPFGLHDVLLDPETAPLSRIVRQIEDLSLYLAPGHIEMARCEALLLSFVDSAYRLRQAIRETAVSDSVPGDAT